MKTERTARTMKKFFWKDKSGRGFTSNSLTVKDLLCMENEHSWNSNPLHEWAKNATQGDTWENAVSEITCIKS